MLRSFIAEHDGNDFVRKRIARNIMGDRSVVGRTEFFRGMVICLLTTQQRSGPESPIARFVRIDPVVLDYEACRNTLDLADLLYRTITEFGGIRRSKKIADEVSTNLERLEAGLWADLLGIIATLEAQHTAEQERDAANYINDRFKGFGPKQSRNLLQHLGLTKFEIPIDSRITKWLNKFGFPVTLNANALSDRHYYNFVSDGIQRLSAAAGIQPCVLDAVIFSSFDEGKWTEDNMVW